MTYTILAATYADAEQTSAVVQTEEAGAVALSAVDTPEEWAALRTSGVQIADYAPPFALPAAPTADQIRTALEAAGKTKTQIDALFALAASI